MSWVHQAYTLIRSVSNVFAYSMLQEHGEPISKAYQQNTSLVPVMQQLCFVRIPRMWCSVVLLWQPVRLLDSCRNARTAAYTQVMLYNLPLWEYWSGSHAAEGATCPLWNPWRHAALSSVTQSLMAHPFCMCLLSL